MVTIAKRFTALIVLAASVLLVGCAPMQVQNTATGAVLGGVAGAIIGDNSESAKRGAILGGVLGALVPVQQGVSYGAPAPYPQQGYGQPMWRCNLPNGQVVPAYSQAHCNQMASQVIQQQRQSLSPAACPGGYRMINGRWVC